MHSVIAWFWCHILHIRYFDFALQSSCILKYFSLFLEWSISSDKQVSRWKCKMFSGGLKSPLEKISMILTFFFVFGYIPFLGVVSKNFLFWHVDPLDQQYLIVMFHVYSFLVIITLCIPVMINPLESSHWPHHCWHYLALSCQSKKFHLGTSI